MTAAAPRRAPLRPTPWRFTKGDTLQQTGTAAWSVPGGDVIRLAHRLKTWHRMETAWISFAEDRVPRADDLVTTALATEAADLAFPQTRHPGGAALKFTPYRPGHGARLPGTPLRTDAAIRLAEWRPAEAALAFGHGWDAQGQSLTRPQLRQHLLNTLAQNSTCQISYHRAAGRIYTRTDGRTSVYVLTTSPR
ncbi:hypothetical protein [Streptomyces sp. NPDC101455]|uniref:hypothetical protein n=1 Tax=Streptomyces sp. NPDC101455 TaxID=3366142 RepID=UPI0038307F94